MIDSPAAADCSCDSRPPPHARTRVAVIGSFEGRALITLERAGAPAWFASEVAAILGLAGASELARQLALDWADEACEGRHWVRVDALELAELRSELEEAAVVLPPSLEQACGSVLLRPAGVALAARRSLGRAGERAARLWTHLEGRVLAELRAAAPGQAALEAEAADIARARLDFERRRWEYQALEQLCDALERDARVDPEVVWAYRVVAVEIALGGDLWQLKPGLEHGWQSPTQIARRHLGVTAQRVGRIISLLGLRDSKVHSKAVVNKAVGRERLVLSYLYSPAAVQLIERELASRGYRRLAAARSNGREGAPGNSSGGTPGSPSPEIGDGW